MTTFNKLRIRSFTIRTALGLATVILLLALLGAAWGRSRAEAALSEQLDLILRAEAEGLIRDYQRFGATALLDAARISARREALLRVLVQTADGTPLAGSLPGAPASLRGYATLAGPEPERALGAILPGGVNLIVAARLSAVQDAARALVWAPLLAAVGAGGVALLLGFAAARALERRLARVSDAASDITAGDLARRLPLSGGGDEFDRLVGTVNAMLARLETSVAAQRQVVEDIAHDLRRPLQRLRQELEAAQASGAAVPEQALPALDSVLGTFAALLRIARAEAGAERLPVNLSGLVTTVAEAYAPVVEDEGRAFSLGVAPGQHVVGDAALLQRMLANLLDNALTHGAGPVHVRLDPGPVLTVEDDGPGIPVAEREAVLRRFTRLDQSRAAPGTGLGLALVAASAQAHQARLILGESAAGGLSVRIEF